MQSAPGLFGSSLFSSSSAANRRSTPRADVAIWVEERTRDALYFQRATNLSLGGLWLEGTLPHPPGTRVVLELELPGDAPMRVEGEVVMSRTERTGMAVRFVGLEPLQKKRLTAFIAASLIA